MTDLVPISTTIVVAESTPAPALVYLARLSPSGRRSQLHALNTMASILSNSVYDAVGLPWANLRYELHTGATNGAHRALRSRDGQPVLSSTAGCVA